MTTHTVKSWSHFYDEIVAGRKMHDMRDMKDRDYKVGDFLDLQRYDNVNGKYTGESALVEITYITSRNTPCAFSSSALDRDYCILSLKLVPDGE
ncbi:ASCH domain-containing protein [Rhizobium phage RHph_TM39]|uniref:ASCH domain-containing protein n=2 Tax=Cuauhnahuacvirus TaxID=3044696 RepID=A0A7S5UX87_9CAUD|nr:ASCH domain-containing protein [Rhizobium phage RHph_TM30]YP_010671200.1 ASCH domain-containing protein [Rhizobium phage RHph_Y65]QIG77041.1 ASCH domain-containing protein [Rhizobium phage RHph_TM39]QIG77640.1 ASCH domain-containing protein [Rhizobium phage RHph_TM61]QIG71160.1 ASCH domain-containing protein [Rhizobium phage RHph_TM30]QIG72609.1 ASCH domain-containing protein [Rhizobium phage RHph_Y65]